MRSRMPEWLRDYQRGWLRGDVLAGLTVGAATIPTALAYAQLAGLPAVHGLYASVVPALPNDASAIRLVGALLIEQNDEWLICRRYLSEESLALVLEDQGEEGREEVVELEAG